MRRRISSSGIDIFQLPGCTFNKNDNTLYFWERRPAIPMPAIRSLRGVVAFVLLLLELANGAARAAPPRVVAVFYPETDTPYQRIFEEILSGIEQGLIKETVRARSLPESPDALEVRRWLDREAPAAVITLGRVATETFEATGLPTPHLIGALDVSPQTRPRAAGVGLAVDPALLFATLRLLAPATRRIWVVFDPGRDRWLIEQAQPAARALDLALLPLEAADQSAAARQFLQILRTADASTDALWLVADAGVVEPETILPVIIEQSWQRKLVVFSGSLQHVRRGVLFALYPDNRQLGRRLAELALQVMAAPRARPGIEPLRAVRRALSLRVASHLDLKVNQEVERQFDVVLPPW